jgi:hypothetical protein
VPGLSDGFEFFFFTDIKLLMPQLAGGFGYTEEYRVIRFGNDAGDGQRSRQSRQRQLLNF